MCYRKHANLPTGQISQHCGRELLSAIDRNGILHVEVVCDSCDWSLDMSHVYNFHFVNNSECVDIEFVWTTPNQYRIPLGPRKKDFVCIVRPDKAKQLVEKYAKEHNEFDYSLPWMVSLMQITKASTYIVEGARRPVQYLERKEARVLYPQISDIL